MKHVLVAAADPRSTAVTVRRGPALLQGIADGPSLTAHRGRHGVPERLGLAELVARARACELRGRGGAGFPFATKLEAVAASRGRPSVVVNLAEGEPASWKDTALASVAPHLILDGAVVVAGALGASDIHVVLPGDRNAARLGLEAAIVERQEEHGPRLYTSVAEVAFVAGQASAVIELLSGRENRPVTTWQPAAVSGLHHRPTMLSNAETFAQVAMLACSSRADRRPTTLLTLDGDTSRPVVREVRLGTPWRKVLPPEALDGPLLLGGYHGTWAAPGALRELRVDREEMARAGLALGAGIVLSSNRCPLDRAADIATYLAEESAGRCGPCVNGLPLLAACLRAAAGGMGGHAEVERLCRLVDRRGACAHPDGTARMARSLLDHFGDELRLHQRGRCTYPHDAARKAG